MFNLCSLFVEEYFTWLWGSLLTKIVSRSRVKHVQWGQIPMVWLQATSLWLGLDTLLLGSIESLKNAKFPKTDDWKTRHYLKSVLFWCPHVDYTPVTLSFVTLLLRELWGTNLPFLSQTWITSLFSEFLRIYSVVVQLHTHTGYVILLISINKLAVSICFPGVPLCCKRTYSITSSRFFRVILLGVFR